MADLTAKNGVLYLGGEYCQTIGFNYFSALQKHWNINANDAGHRFAEDFVVLGNQAGGKNIKIIKVMITPFDAAGTGGHTAVLGSTPGATTAAYFTDATKGVDALFQSAIDNGISIIVSFNWNYKCYPDMYSESYDAWDNPSSQTSIYSRAFLTEFVTRYTTGTRADLTNAIAGWALWTETENSIFRELQVAGTNAGIGISGYSRVASEFRSTLKSLDSRRRVLMGLTSVIPFGKTLGGRVPVLRALEGKADFYKLFDVIDAHVYSGNRGVGILGSLDTVAPSTKAEAVREKYASTDSFKGYINTLMLFGKSINRPVMFSEFGISEQDDAYASRSYITKNLTWIASTVTAVTTLSCADMDGLAVGQVFTGVNFGLGAGKVSQILSVSAATGAGTFTFGPGILGTVALESEVVFYNSTDNTNVQFQRMVDAIKYSGLQLALCWNWNEPEQVTSQSTWSVQAAADARGFHTKRYKQLDSIVAANKIPTIRPVIRTPVIPTKFASLKYKQPHGLTTNTGAGVPAALSAALNAGNPEHEFSISFRIRQNNSNDNYATTNFISVMELKEASAGPGFWMGISPSGISTGPLAGSAPTIFSGANSQSIYIELKRADGAATLTTSSGITSPTSSGVWTYLTYIFRKRAGSGYDGAVGDGGITCSTASNAVTGSAMLNSHTSTKFLTAFGAGTAGAGMKLYTASGVELGTVANVTTNTDLTLAANALATISTAQQYRYKDNFYTLYQYRDGLPIDTKAQNAFLAADIFNFPASPTLSLFSGSTALASTSKTIPFDLADVSLYNRPLTADEVYSAYVGEPPVDYVAHYKLDKIENGTFLDSSANRFDLIDNSSGALLVDNSVITRAARV